MKSEKAYKAFGEFINDLIKKNPSAAPKIREAFTLTMAKSLADEGPSPYFFASPTPAAAPAKPKPVATAFIPGDSVLHKPTKQHGIVVATAGTNIAVQYLDDRIDIHPDSELEKEEPLKDIKAFVRKNDSSDVDDGQRRWFSELAKTIRRSASPFGR
jgi:hypothetical protein